MLLCGSDGTELACNAGDLGSIPGLDVYVCVYTYTYTQNTGVVGLSLLQGIFPTQGSNPGLTHWGGFFTS